MPELHEEARNLIRQEVKRLTEEERALVKELIILKNTGNLLAKAHILLLTLILGGSIASFFVIGTYLDNIVAHAVSERLQVVDRFSTAIALGYSGDWDSALGSLSVVWHDLEKNPDLFSRDFINNFYGNLLWVLSSTERDYSGEWIGKEHWKRLRGDKLYHSLKLDWANDANSQINLARCELKFSDDKTIEHAGLRLKTAYSMVNSKFEKANIAYQLGLYYSALGKNDNAKLCFRVASSFDPGEYRVADWGPYYGSFVNAYDFSIWRQVYLEKTGEDFADFVSSLMKELDSEEQTSDQILEGEELCPTS